MRHAARVALDGDLVTRLPGDGWAIEANLALRVAGKFPGFGSHSSEVEAVGGPWGKQEGSSTTNRTRRRAHSNPAEGPRQEGGQVGKPLVSAFRPLTADQQRDPK